jgi:hypothetical protein
MKRLLAPRRIGLVASLVTLTLLGLQVIVGASGSSARSGALAVRRAATVPPGLFVRGSELTDEHGGRRRLADPALAPLVGSAGPVAAPSPDGRLVAYNTWRWSKPIDWRQSLGQQGIETGDMLGMPRLRILDLRSGKDEALEPGSFSVAWRADGALAYVRGTPPPYLANTPYLRNVLVRGRPNAEPVAWTSEPDRYLVDGWAGRTLIVERGVPGGTPDILALEAPGSSRTLAEKASFLAVSPDGSEILVARGMLEGPAPSVSLIDVGSGETKASLDLGAVTDPATSEPVQWAYGPASWREDRVVMPASPGLLVLSARSSLAVEQVLHLDSATKPDGILYEPRFTDDTTHTIVAWSDVPGTKGESQSVQFVCDRYALRCDRGASVPSTEAPRPVYDESGGHR